MLAEAKEPSGVGADGEWLGVFVEPPRDGVGPRIVTLCILARSFLLPLAL